MGTSAFDLAWEQASKPMPKSEFDRAWDTAVGARKAKTPEQIARLKQNADELHAADVARDRAEKWEAIVGTLAAPLSEIPGGRAVQAAIAGRGNYRRGLEQVDKAIASAPAATRVPAKVLGGVVGAMAMPGSAAMQGARFGALSGLLDANPDADVGDRLRNAAVSGTVGLFAGKAGEMLGTGFSALRAPTPGAAQTALLKAIEDAARPGYEAFRKLGDLGRTPKLTELLRLPAIRTALKAVRGESPVLAKLPATHARVLDAIYKRVGNKAFKATHGFETTEARVALLDAIEEAAKAKGGSYADPVGVFRAGMQKLKALQRGRAALKTAGSKSGGADKAPLASSPEAFANWAKTATPAERAAAATGILGQVARGPMFQRAHVLGTELPLLWPSAQLRAAPGLLGNVQTQSPSAAILRGLLTQSLTPTP